MEINQALSIAKQLKDHFRAFERLDEFIKEATALQNLLSEFEDRKAQLQKDIQELENKKISSDKTFKLKVEDLEHRWVSIKESDETKLTEHKAIVLREIKKFNLKRDAAKSMMEDAIKAHDEEMQRMRLETEDAQKTLTAVETRLHNIKAKLESLGEA